MKPHLLSARWTNLLVVNFETTKTFLEKYLPAGTELNDWNGKFFMSLVGFQFSKTKFCGIPSPFYRSFPEINLRFYVKRKTKDGWQKGVVFIKEIASAKLIVLMAGWLYNENFISLKMKSNFLTDGDKNKIEYCWNINNEWNYMKAVVKNESVQYPEESFENFISSHYHGYTRVTEIRTKEFEVIHRPWKIYPVISFEIKLNAEAIYGKEAYSFFSQQPYSVFMMDGSETKVTWPSSIL
jgi:uncharacterized protein